MSGRTLMVGQVWENWADRSRFRIDEIGVNWAKGMEARADGDMLITAPNLTLLHDTILSHYLYIGEVVP